MDTHKIPETLYHYCSNETFCSIINNKSIWLSSLFLTNDTMEGKWINNKLLEVCRRENIKAPKLDRVAALAEFCTNITHGFAFCLSERKDSLSQWRGYADDGQGVCIGFKSAVLQSSKSEEQPEYDELRQVIYDHNAQEALLKPLVEKLKNHLSNGAFDDENSTPLTMGPRRSESLGRLFRDQVNTDASLEIIKLSWDLFRFKNPVFHEEEEWRLLSQGILAEMNDISYRGVGSKIVPYKNRDIKRAKGIPVITEVILGPKNLSDLLSVYHFLDRNGFPDVYVRPSDASYR